MATLKSLIDETTNIKDELVACHTNLKNNLIKKGVECSGSDKISSLIDRVGGIELGKKWAVGRIIVNSFETKELEDIHNNSKTSCKCVLIPKQSYTPSYIRFEIYDSHNRVWSYGMVQNMSLFNTFIETCKYRTTTLADSFYSYMYKFNEFAQDENFYYIPLTHTANLAGKTGHWIMIE